MKPDNEKTQIPSDEEMKDNRQENTEEPQTSGTETEKGQPEETDTAQSAAEDPEAGTEDPGETVSDEEAAQAADADYTPLDDEKKGGFFRKKEKKDKKDEKIADLTDRIQRQMAEFDNFRKRTTREKEAMYDMGARDVIEKILPVVDNFERGLASAAEDDSFADGMNKIYKQMLAVLTDLGVTPIEAEGQVFDPNFHNAVMHEDNPDVGENIITQELQKGYMYKDTVLRYSMVRVAN